MTAPIYLLFSIIVAALRFHNQKDTDMAIRGLLLSAIAVLLIAGCAPVISKETLGTVNRGLEFSEVAGRPADYIGQSVVFGGTILETRNEEGRTVIEVLQEGLDSRLRPAERGESAGRFLVEFPEFKDPAIYSKGKRITVAGEVIGSERQRIGRGTYDYPVIQPREHSLLDPPSYDPGPRIGIGIGLGYTRVR